jgi:hypothetical protein
MADYTKTNRNKIRKTFEVRDGAGNLIFRKVKFFPKQFHSPQYANLKEIWDAINKSPKPQSKRQQKIREEKGILFN